jgi:predicted AlkP superfamily pyrophosphatase or phosphodiesterase
LPFFLLASLLFPSLCQDYDNIDSKCTWRKAKFYNSKVVKIFLNEHCMGIILTHYMELHCFTTWFDWFDLNFSLNKKWCHPYSILKSLFMVSIFIGGLEIAMQQ